MIFLYNNPVSRHHQQGAVLVISLILLLILTLLGVTSMSSSNLEEKMAGNLRDKEIAFQSAEAALREAERIIESTTLTAFDCSCTDGLCNCKDGDCVKYWTDATLDVWNTAGRYEEYSTTFAETTSKAKYIIEFMNFITPAGSAIAYVPTIGDPQMYRITAIGTGRTDGARVMLQTTYQKDSSSAGTTSCCNVIGTPTADYCGT